MQQQGSPAVLNKYMPPSQQQPTDTNPEETKFNEIDKRLTDMERRTDLATRADKVRKDMYSRQEVQLDAIAQQRKVQQKKMDLINQARGVVGGQQMPS